MCVMESNLYNCFSVTASPTKNLGFRPPRRVSYDQKAAVQNGSGGAPTGGYNGGGNDAPRVGYNGPGRRDGYSRGNGGYGYGRGNGRYHGNGEYRQRQQQGDNVGRFQRERPGNGGYYLRHGGQQQRRAANDRYYREHRDSSPVLNVEDMCPSSLRCV